MASASKEIETEILPLIRIYKDGTVERLIGYPIGPPTLQDPQTRVSSKDIVISDDPSISARVYLPDSTQSFQKLPILVYFHGGGFCVGSASSVHCHRYLNLIVSEANVIAVSIEYRLAPEHTLPAAYDDCWQALDWVASHSNSSANTEAWLKNHGDFSRVYIGGDSAGGNIVHNVALRAGVEALNNNVKILGAILSNPYFWGSEPVGSEPNHDSSSYNDRVWNLAYPSAPCGIDNPLINPCGPGAPSLATIGCSKLLVCVAGKDELRDRGIWYCEAVKNSGWEGEVELFEIEDEGHCFYIYDPQTENAKTMIRRLASFLL